MERIIFGLVWIVVISSKSSLAHHACRPEVRIKEVTNTSASLEWECNFTKEHPIVGYLLSLRKLYKKTDRDSPTDEEINLSDPDIKTHTFQNLHCGDVYFIEVSSIDHEGPVFSSEREPIYVGRTDFPEIEEFLEIGANSVTLKLDRWRLQCASTEIVTLLQNSGNKRNPSRTNLSAKHVTVSGLKANTEYTLFVGDQGDDTTEGTTYTFKTLCNENESKWPYPVDLMTYTHNSVTLNLDELSCFLSLAVEYREREVETWTSVMQDIRTTQKSLLIQDLSGNTEYVLRLTGRHQSGEDIKEYDFRSRDFGECNDGWIKYPSKCVKYVPDAGRVTKKEAELICQKMQDSGPSSSLVTLSHLSDQHSADFVFEDAPREFWLGMESEDGYLYHWDDGSPVRSANWRYHLPPRKDERCAKVTTEVRNEGTERASSTTFWVKTSCQSHNYVICQQPYVWPLAKLRTEFVKLEKRQRETEQMVQSLLKKVNLAE